MIVFDLKCTRGHVFEAWFGSSTAYETQRERGLVACPMCADTAVEKAVMAPAVAAKGNRTAAAGPAVKAALQQIARRQAEMLASSEWVGTGFADRARAMHLGETERATIHGQATLAEAKALVDEGVPVAPLPLPVVPPGKAN